MGHLIHNLKKLCKLILMVLAVNENSQIFSQTKLYRHVELMQISRGGKTLMSLDSLPLDIRLSIKGAANHVTHFTENFACTELFSSQLNSPPTSGVCFLPKSLCV